MSDHLAYLIINLASLAIPLAFSFEHRIRFFSQWRFWMVSIAVPGAFFIAWDIIFTSWGVWGFNPRYITGVSILGLPLEEWMFFFCIPYACLFTYQALGYLIPIKVGSYVTYWITALLLGFLIIVLCFNFDKAYTASSFLFLSVALAFHQWWRKSEYLGRFYLAYLFILVPFFLVNGILTGSFIAEEIVWYNDHENLGWRMFTIPLEDTFYGMLLILMNVSVYEFLKKRNSGTG